MRRWRLAGAVAGMLSMGGMVILATGGSPSAAAPSRPLGSPPRTSSGVLRIFSSNPILVRAGERAIVPVDVVCATANGEACSATVSLQIQEGSGAKTVTSAEALPGLAFDVSAAAGRAVTDGAAGSVGYRLSARDEQGREVTLGEGALRFYVTSDMPVVQVPAIPFGEVRAGSVVLSLPWGTGPMRAGIALGNESLTRGPSSFDIADDGSIVLADALQGRLAVFRAGRLIRETRLDMTPQASVAVTRGGATYVIDRAVGGITVRLVDRLGRVGPSTELGAGIPAEVGTIGEVATVNVLPADTFDAVALGEGAKAPAFPLSVGRPTGTDGSERLLRVAREGFIRVGSVRDGRVHDAVELRSGHRFAELAMAEPDGSGGYLVAVHVWRMTPTPADQYQVIHVADGRIVTTFALSAAHFAETPPLSRIRLGPDGALYQMTTSPDGMRIVRFDLSGGAT